MEEVESAQTHYLIRYGVVVILLVVPFLFMVAMKRKRRAGVRPVQANGDALASSNGARPAGWDNYKPRPRPNVLIDLDAPSPQSSTEARNGVVYFNWNGHSWNAFEVLGLDGIPNSLAEVEAAFQRAQAKCDAESLPFLRAAYDAILAS